MKPLKTFNGDPIKTLISFIFISFVVAFTSTAIKHDDFKSIVKSGISLFFMMVGGIFAFCVLLQLLGLFT